MKTPYDDIISLPHHVSRVHPQMPMYSRAAQFAPFAALSGHEAAISETARQTDTERELADSEAEMLDRKFAVLLQKRRNNPKSPLPTSCRIRKRTEAVITHQQGTSGRSTRIKM